MEPALVTEPAPFWMIWNKKGHMPRHFHQSRATADTEAARLANPNPGRKYIVLQGVAKVHVPAVAVVQAEAA